jgi:penicillin-binding protein 1A
MFWTAFNVVIIALIAIGYLFYINSKDLPSYEQLETYQPPIVTRFYAADGKLLEEYAREHRLFMPIDEIPDLVKDAFISAEDKHFYTHPGIDLTGILRAVIKNVVANAKGKKSLVGGSTITQQVVKNFLLTKEKSINRKIKEAILSFRITKMFSKDKILELYLNEIFLGARSYGVASAALNYFNKSLNDLNLEEAAFLAALPQAPSYYNPYRNLERALSRRNWVIERMYEDEYVTKENALEAVASPITLVARDKREVADADFFAEAVRQNVAEIYGDKSLYESGLMVRTSLNSRLQKIGETALRNGIEDFDQRHGYRGAITKIKPGEDWAKKLAAIPSNGINIKPWRYAVILKVMDDEVQIGFADKKRSNLDIIASKWAIPEGRRLSRIFSKGDVVVVDKDSVLKQIPKINGALVAMDPHTGRVLALVGGYSFDNSKFNRATQALRQPGSAFKPFVYLAALENNVTPTTIFDDSYLEMEQGSGLPMWTPKNFFNDFLGPLTFRRGLELSRNPVTVRVAQDVGMEKIVEIAKRFGIANDPQPYYSMVLGAMETTLLRLSNAYSIIANGGHKVTPTLIDKIQDRNGKLIYSSDNRNCINCYSSNELIPRIQEGNLYITDPRSAYQLVSIMEGVVAHTKTSVTIRALGRTIAGKTGTTNDAKDVWFMGFSPDLMVGVYLGYDDPRSLGARESGGRSAQPVFVEFMKKALAKEIDKPFKMPDGLKLVKINYLTGEPTTTQAGSIYEVFKRSNYKESDDMKMTQIDTNPTTTPVQPEEVEEEEMSEPNLEEVENEGIY